MTKVISCFECTISLGEIRDATLRVNIVHLCNICAEQHLRLKTEIRKLIADRRTAVPPDSPFYDVFGEILGKRRK